MKKRTNIIIAVVTVVAFGLFVKYIYLPYAAQQDQVNKVTDAVQASHLLREPTKQVPPFSFTNMDGKTITQKDLEGKVYVADFFYTSCEAFCPRMSTQLSKVQNTVNKSEPFRIVSFSLDPVDSAEQIRHFANMYHANDSIWYFLYGDADKIYDLGKNGFLQTVVTDSAAFVNHSQKFVLVDKAGWIRGFYNGLDTTDVALMIRDIDYLMFKDDAHAGENN
ncbi:MAG: SCO family protein [Chitinophagales bacterium]